MARIVDDTRGYYLLGFDTGISATDRWDPNDVRIRVTRPGLTVRARRGLFGPADKERPREAASPDPLVAAALSPFANGTIDVRLTTLFAHDKKAGSYVRALFFIDPAGLTFAVGADGRHEADMSLLLLAIGDNGVPVAHARIEVPLRLDDAAYQRLRQRGLLYSTRLAIREPGGYQIRAALQDDRSKALGTSAQFVEVPKVGKNQVALSGVVMMDVASATAAADGQAATDAAPVDVIADGVLGEPAIKIFKPGSRSRLHLRDLRRPGQAHGWLLDQRHAAARRQAVLHDAGGARRRGSEGCQAGGLGPRRRHPVARPPPAARHLHAAGQRRAAVGRRAEPPGVPVGRFRSALRT